MTTSVDAGFTLSAQLRKEPRHGGGAHHHSTSVSSQLGLNFRPRSAEDLAKMNVDAYFDKPIAADALLAKVGSVLAAAAHPQPREVNS